MAPTRGKETLEHHAEDRVLTESPIATRSERFAAQFKAVNDELMVLVDNCTPDEWRRTSVEEGWSVAVVAHHIATSSQAFRKLVEEVAANVSLLPRVTIEAVNAGNARHAKEFAAVSQDEVLDLLRVHGPQLEAVLRDLTEEQLAHTTSIFMDHEYSLAEIIERIVIGHARMHLASLRATLADELDA